MMAVVQLRNATQGRAYYDRKVAAGKTPGEAMRCPKRRLSASSTAPCPAISSPARGRAREDTGETTLTPARPAHIPTPALRTSHFPDPPPPSLEPHDGRLLDTEGSQMRMSSPGDLGRARLRVWARVCVRSWVSAALLGRSARD
jgi:hypothetical protein